MPGSLRDALDKALYVVHELCTGKRQWIMSIPANEERDPDLIIANALISARDYLNAHPEPGLRERVEAYAAKCDERKVYVDGSRLGDVLRALLPSAPEETGDRMEGESEKEWLDRVAPLPKEKPAEAPGHGPVDGDALADWILRDDQPDEKPGVTRSPSLSNAGITLYNNTEGPDLARRVTYSSTLPAPADDAMRRNEIVRRFNGPEGDAAADSLHQPAPAEEALGDDRPSAWLIESTFSGPHSWWGARRGMSEQWVGVNDAVRFQRRRDAELAIRLLDLPMAKATEHVWIDNDSAPEEKPAEETGTDWSIDDVRSMITALTKYGIATEESVEAASLKYISMARQLSDAVRRGLYFQPAPADATVVERVAKWLCVFEFGEEEGARLWGVWDEDARYDYRSEARRVLALIPDQREEVARLRDALETVAEYSQMGRAYYALPENIIDNIRAALAATKGARDA